MKRISLILVAVLLASIPVKADEGMWLPMFIKRLNYVDMQKQGLKLTAEEIYSVNESSLKDAIVRMGRGFCTGEMISDQGLLLTNHHCGFSVIQQYSSEENNYLDDGFWAMDKSEELPAGFSVSFLKRMEDVSNEINPFLNEEMSYEERMMKIKQISDSLQSAAVEGTQYEAEVKSFYNGNEFYMFIYEIFPDVRWVGSPPTSIGKFGGDTDNWMWPRHTGDFTLFRVYANKDNEPAPYSEENVPYKPAHHLPISLKGINEGDFAMIFGYPGGTDRFLTSPGVSYELETRQPAYVKLRRQVLDIYEDEMRQDEGVRIKYASKHASISNYWKYFKGQSAGLKRLNVYEKKKAIEDSLADWINQTDNRKERYSSVLEGLQTGYSQKADLALVTIYLNEAVFRTEAVAYSFQFSELKRALEAENDTLVNQTVEQLKAGLDEHYKDYVKSIDKQVFAAMMKAYSEDIPKEYQPEEFKKIVAKFKGDFNKMADQYFAKTSFADKQSTLDLLNKPKAKSIDKDPLYNIMKILYNDYLKNIRPQLAEISKSMSKSERLFVKALREMNPEQVYAPDANSTMRVTYGKVLGYDPYDGAHYYHYTTAEGILEKEDNTDPEFVVPEKLNDLIVDKDFSIFANEKGELPVNFITNNDITGGNSGSPIINGNGELIGSAFDGNWEAMSGDIAFEHDLQRCIGVDIRYVLFIIEKYANASHLIKEMTLVR